jgi:hypothetical protein
VQVTIGTPSPSIVITNERRRRIRQLSIGLLSQKSLEVCEIQVYGYHSDLLRELTPIAIAFFHSMGLIVYLYIILPVYPQPNRASWIESSNAQGG